MNARRDTTGAYILGLGILALGIFLTLSLYAPNFMSRANLISMGSQFPEFGLLALALLPTMISGGIDLSVVAIANLSSIIASLFLRAGPEYAWMAVPAALLTGLACGALNGLIVIYGRLQPIVTTIATGAAFFGIALLLRPFPGGEVHEGIADFLTGQLPGGIPASAVALLVVVLV
ncbi:MAG: ABC transporter permease, partial [Aliihoeflea sp.]